jgi:hypothetical protein
MYPGEAAKFDRDVRQCLEMAAEEVRRDLRDSHTLPRRDGHLTQETYVDRTQSGKGKVSVVSDTPYARRLYFHPEYNFRKQPNEAAGAHWFEPYKKGGSKERFAARRFAEFMRRRRGA